MTWAIPEPIPASMLRQGPVGWCSSVGVRAPVVVAVEAPGGAGAAGGRISCGGRGSSWHAGAEACCDGAGRPSSPSHSGLEQIDEQRAPRPRRRVRRARAWPSVGPSPCVRAGASSMSSSRCVGSSERNCSTAASGSRPTCDAYDRMKPRVKMPPGQLVELVLLDRVEETHRDVGLLCNRMQRDLLALPCFAQTFANGHSARSRSRNTA